MNGAYPQRRHAWQGLLQILFAAYCLALLYGTLAPFDFTSDPEAFDHRSKPIEWIPFTYVCPHCTYDTNDKLLNLAIFVPFGVSLGLILLRSNSPASAVVTRTTIAGLLLRACPRSG